MSRLAQTDEDSFKVTNAFTTVDDRSPLKMSEEYKHIQRHIRTAAARAHKKIYKNYGPVPFHEHTMVCKCFYTYELAMYSYILSTS